MIECIFCKIIKGEIPCDKIYEDSKFLAFLDIRPLAVGHTLVIPKSHERWVWDISDIGGYFEVVAQMANAQKKVLKLDMIKSIIVGDEVPHAHVHLVPYKPNGEVRSVNFSKFINVSKEINLEFIKKIISELNRLD